MPEQSEFTAWKNEQAYLAQERLRHPDRFLVPDRPASERLQYTGITAPRQPLPVGFIKFSPFDFIVEEVLPDGTAATVDAPAAQEKTPTQNGLVHAILVKAGLFSTVDAVQALADALGTSVANIRHAGIKDANALTAQRMSIAGVPIKKIVDLHLSGMRLQKITPAKEPVRVGQLQGNRFTIVIRTPQAVDHGQLEQAMQRISTEGFINFYGEQRFGMPRIHTMHCGKLLLAGKFDEALHLFLTGTTPFEQPFVTALRTEAESYYGDWKKMHDLFARLPYTLRNELSMLNVLAHTQGATTSDAFKAATMCVKYWALAYGSYLTNMVLSRNENLPETLGLLLNKTPNGDSVYADFLRDDGTTDYRTHIAKLAFVPLSDNPTIPTRITPTFHGVHVSPTAVTISFDLPKGAYATTCLYNLFDLQSVPGIPTWLDRADINSKQQLGTGDIAPLFKRFDSARQETILRNIFFTRTA